MTEWGVSAFRQSDGASSAKNRMSLYRFDGCLLLFDGRLKDYPQSVKRLPVGTWMRRALEVKR